MAKTGIKVKDTEDLSKETIKKVIELLNADQPITKKAACEILKISYNTTRLEKIIKEFHEKENRRKQMFAKKRGTNLETYEVQEIISSYLLEHAPISSISERLFRSQDTINRTLDTYNVPRRSTSYSYFHPEMIPDEAVKDKFQINEKVWSAKYESAAIIKDEKPHKIYGFAYLIWLLDEKWQQHAWQPACELASFDNLTKEGITI